MKKTTNKTLLVLGGLLLIIVGISSGCIGGKGDGGTDSDVTGASGGAGGGAAVQQPETQTPAVPEEETQTVDKPLLPKSLRALTPGETVEEYFKAGQEERYTDAAKYWAKEGTAKNEYRFFGIWPENGAKNKKIEILKSKEDSDREIWSEEYQKPIKYEVVRVSFKVYYTKDGKEKIENNFFPLIKIDNIWKLDNLS